MDKYLKLRMALISAALNYAASNMYFQYCTTSPDPHEDATMELRDDMLVEAAKAYVEAMK